MIATGNYTQIAQMIMRRLGQADPSSRGLGYGGGGGSGGGSAYAGGDVVNPYSPDLYGNDFDGFDYHLLYNEEEDMIGFTSHDGKLTWMFVFDSFDTLYEVEVTTPTTSFIIALIWENFDIRKNDPETDDKGLLTDVVILDKDGQAIKEGLILVPESIIVNAGDQISFRCMLLRVDGTQTDITTSCTWETDDMTKYPISVGVINNAKVGSGKVIASYQYSKVEGVFEVKDFSLSIRPGKVSVPVKGKASYDAFVRYYTDEELSVTADCVWECSGPAILYGNIADAGTEPGEYSVVATYQGKTANAVLEVLPDTLVVVPATQTVEKGQQAQFNAKLQVTGVDVTNDSQWVCEKYPVDKGLVTETNEAGTTTVCAIYNGQTAEGQLIVNAPVIDPQISHEFDWKITMRWEGNCRCDVDMNVFFSGCSTDGHLYYGHKQVTESENDKAWLDIDYTDHSEEGAYDTHPEVVTILGKVGTSARLVAVMYALQHGSLTAPVDFVIERVVNGALQEKARFSVPADSLNTEGAAIDVCELDFETEEINGLL